MKKLSVLLILLSLIMAAISSGSAFAQAWGECVIPPSGPWPPCASGNGGSGSNTTPLTPSGNGNNGNCEIPASGPWPPCASGNGGGGSPTLPTGSCQIPTSGPWPPCATQGGGLSSPTPPTGGNSNDNSGGCEIPSSGPWPPCATQGGGGTAPTNPNTNPPSNPSNPSNPTPPTGSLPQGYLLGAQTHTFAHPAEMKQAGMSWVKIQHKWEPGHDGEAVRERIQRVHSQGMKVLLSLPGVPYPNAIDFNSYVQFLGSVAAEGPDAIEIWSEPNIDFEWPAGQINPASYVNNMLKPGYQRIKSVNPNILVISGAPAPTGFFGGCGGAGCDDKPYVEGMFNAGAGDYLDCVGIHYNEGVLSPSATSGDPRNNADYYTRYYSTMVSTYRNAIGDKPLCFTEYGYLSFEGFDMPADSPFGWAKGTSAQNQADWLGEAVTLTKNDPGIMMLIVFNMDIESYGVDPQAAFALIRPDGSCPSCWTIKSAVSR